MRLGQLARRLAVRPAEILEFLSLREIHLENDSNTRLSDNDVVLITNHFSPPEINTVIPAPVQESSPAVTEAFEETKEQPIQNEIIPTESSQSEQHSSEIIRAPKVELSGLRIVGKIDLAEPKKKDTPTSASEGELQEEDISTVATEKRRQTEEKKYANGNGKKKLEERRPRKNPIAQQREHEALEAERKKHERAIQQKEQRTKNYLKKVRIAAPTKSVKIIGEPTEEFSKIEEAPKTFFGRIIRWFKA